MLSFPNHSCADGLRALPDDPLFILARAFPQPSVEFFPTAQLRYRHQMIPAKVPAFSFHPTLLVAFPRRTEFRLKTPMRSEGHETRGLLSLVPAQNLFHRQGEVVIAKRFKYAAKISEGPLPSFLATPWIVPVPCSYSRRICSNSSTLALLSKPYPLPGRQPQKTVHASWLGGWAKSKYRSGPNESIEINWFGAPGLALGIYGLVKNLRR